MGNYRTYDGTDNGATDRDVGAAGKPLHDLGLCGRPFDPGRAPNPRRVSSRVSRTRRPEPDPWRRSEFMWAWGQFLDHELDLVDLDVHAPVPLRVPDDDPRVEFRGTTMSLTRSRRTDGELLNEHTSYVDASNVYGTSTERARYLRLHREGLLRWSSGPGGDQLLPVKSDPRLSFEAGDRRVDEHGVLVAMHTVWLREHNRLCRVLARHYDVRGDEQLFQRARALVYAQMQVITYREFLPALLGTDSLDPWTRFRPEVDPRISNAFATAFYRIGHTMVADDVILADEGQPLLLRDAFMVPDLVTYIGIEPFLSHLARRPMRRIDTEIADGLREHLFPDSTSRRVELRDLATLNIHRGRDHELPSLNQMREHYGLQPVGTFAELTSDRRVAGLLGELYSEPDECDLWVAALAEEPCGGRRVGDLMHAALVDQFARVRDGDAHWWQCDPTLALHERRWVARRRLADVLRDNTRGLQFPDDVFNLSGPYSATDGVI